MSFDLLAPGAAEAAVYDVAGRRVRRLQHGVLAGAHTVAWDGSSNKGAPVRAGLYFARVAVAGAARVVRVVRLE